MKVYLGLAVTWWQLAWSGVVVVGDWLQSLPGRWQGKARWV